MQLKAWLKETGHTREWLARETGIGKRRIDTIIYGAEPRLKEAISIEEVTLGGVKLNDWIERNNPSFA